jgi:hypothetical protein
VYAVENPCDDLRTGGGVALGSTEARMETITEIAGPSPAKSAAEARRKAAARAAARAAGRSKITNGTTLLVGVDGRSPWVRRCKDVIAEHVADLGGADNTSAAERSIIRRAAVLTTELERLEAVFALAGEASAVELDIYARIAANLRRLLESVGLKRRSRDVNTFRPLQHQITERRDADVTIEATTIDAEPS